jgi:hypothetical protein
MLTLFERIVFPYSLVCPRLLKSPTSCNAS